MRRTSKYNSNKAEMTASGEYGFMYFGASSEQTYTAPTGYCFSAVQPFEDAWIKECTASCEAVITIPDDGFLLPEGQTLLIRADEITITEGTGILYLGGM